ncbi:hypothetical protein Slin15195_G077820 [Septoria linicola]|uniref:Uncharacterized protein n=1 Tax=Septoria linicola TaxID=215465 RepID=A0A9Q9AYN5_9PEZI|nr:hypothetical protein Slin15195_G077820 [Septoria linicola]
MLLEGALPGISAQADRHNVNDSRHTPWVFRFAKFDDSYTFFVLQTLKKTTTTRNIVVIPSGAKSDMRLNGFRLDVKNVAHHWVVRATTPNNAEENATVPALSYIEPLLWPAPPQKLPEDGLLRGHDSVGSVYKNPMLILYLEKNFPASGKKIYYQSSYEHEREAVRAKNAERLRIFQPKAKPPKKKKPEQKQTRSSQGKPKQKVRPSESSEQTEKTEETYSATYYPIQWR